MCPLGFHRWLYSAWVSVTSSFCGIKSETETPSHRACVWCKKTQRYDSYNNKWVDV